MKTIKHRQPYPYRFASRENAIKFMETAQNGKPDKTLCIRPMSLLGGKQMVVRDEYLNAPFELCALRNIPDDELTPPGYVEIGFVQLTDGTAETLDESNRPKDN